MAETNIGANAPTSTVGAGRWALAALLVGAIGIGFAPIFVRLSELGPSATAFHRIALVLPAFWLLSAIRPAPPAAIAAPGGGSGRLYLLLAGVFFAADLIAWHWSIRFTSVANATLLANVAPVFVALGAHLLFREVIGAGLVAGLAAALAGAALLAGADLALATPHARGDGLGLLAALFYAAYILSVGRLRARFSTLTVMMWTGIGSAPVLLAAALISGEPLFAATAAGWAILAGLAYVSHGAGQGLIAYALAHLPATFSAVALMVQPLVSAVLAWALLSEALRPVQALGGALILAGIWLARRTRPRR